MLCEMHSVFVCVIANKIQNIENMINFYLMILICVFSHEI